MNGAYESNDHFQLGWCAHACSAHTGARSEDNVLLLEDGSVTN